MWKLGLWQIHRNKESDIVGMVLCLFITTKNRIGIKLYFVFDLYQCHVDNIRGEWFILSL